MRASQYPRRIWARHADVMSRRTSDAASGGCGRRRRRQARSAVPPDGRRVCRPTRCSPDPKTSRAFFAPECIHYEPRQARPRHLRYGHHSSERLPHRPVEHRRLRRALGRLIARLTHWASWSGGSIAAGMRHAGEDFRRHFGVAGGAIRGVGGIALPASSCLWHVVGLGTFVSGPRAGAELAGRRVSQEAASGILIQALQKSISVKKSCGIRFFCLSTKHEYR